MGDPWIWATFGLALASVALGIGFARALRRTRIGACGFCARCGYSKAGLADEDCPECGCRIQTNHYVEWRRLAAAGIPLSVAVVTLGFFVSGGGLLGRLPEPVLLSLASPGTWLGQGAHEEVCRRAQEVGSSAGVVEYALRFDLSQAIAAGLVAPVRNPVARDAPVFVRLDEYCNWPVLQGATVRVFTAAGREVAEGLLGGHPSGTNRRSWLDWSRELSADEAMTPLTVTLSYPCGSAARAPRRTPG